MIILSESKTISCTLGPMWILFTVIAFWAALLLLFCKKRILSIILAVIGGITTYYSVTSMIPMYNIYLQDMTYNELLKDYTVIGTDGAILTVVKNEDKKVN
jgi:hypothetical protein